MFRRKSEIRHTNTYLRSRTWCYGGWDIVLYVPIDGLLESSLTPLSAPRSYLSRHLYAMVNFPDHTMEQGIEKGQDKMVVCSTVLYHLFSVYISAKCMPQSLFIWNDHSNISDSTDKTCVLVDWAKVIVKWCVNGRDVVFNDILLLMYVLTQGTLGTKLMLGQYGPALPQQPVVKSVECYPGGRKIHFIPDVC